MENVYDTAKSYIEKNNLNINYYTVILNMEEGGPFIEDF